MKRKSGLLSEIDILENLRTPDNPTGGIIIDPFNPDNLKGASYDVRLGEWYFRADRGVWSNMRILNPYDSQAITTYWGRARQARTLAAEIKEGRVKKDFQINCQPSEQIPLTRQVIIVQPGEFILAHTEEFIGGTLDERRNRLFTTEMRARSSVGRLGFEMCRCAGWGDPGYVNRWTMEVNNDSELPVILAVGTRVAQIAFYEVTPIARERLYGAKTGVYQTGVEIQNIKDGWQPEMMLPKLKIS